MRDSKQLARDVIVAVAMAMRCLFVWFIFVQVDTIDRFCWIMNIYLVRKLRKTLINLHRNIDKTQNNSFQVYWKCPPPACNLCISLKFLTQSVEDFYNTAMFD